MSHDNHYLGMNVSNPTTALPSTSRAGLTLYWSKINRTATAIAPVSTPEIAPFAMLKQPASSRPIDTGARPCWIDVLHGHFSSFLHALATTKASTAVGPKKAISTTIAPSIPP